MKYLWCRGEKERGTGDNRSTANSNRNTTQTGSDGSYAEWNQRACQARTRSSSRHAGWSPCACQAGCVSRWSSVNMGGCGYEDGKCEDGELLRLHLLL